MQNKKVLTILRHEKSLNIVREFVESKGGTMIAVALDPVELPDQVDAALAQIKSALAAGVDVIAMGTKVYDPVKGGPSHLPQFLTLLKEYGVGDTPIALTHLVEYTDADKQGIAASGLNITSVENDNLGRDGMINFGPLIEKAIAA